jgi:hypothetical protein
VPYNVEEFVEKDERNERFRKLRAQRTKHVVRFSESLIVAQLANGKKVGEDRFYVAWAS